MALYHKGFQAKEFRILCRIVPYAMHKVKGRHELILLMCNVAKLCCLLSKKRITEVEMTELKKLVSVIVSVSHLLSPTCNERSKTHIMLHLIDSIEQFGMPYVYDVECFESLNKSSRFAIQHSNNTNDSKAALQYWIKDDNISHLLSGGYYTDSYNDIIKPGTKLIENVTALFTTLTLEDEATIDNEAYFKDGLHYFYCNSVQQRKLYQVQSINIQYGWPALIIKEDVEFEFNDMIPVKIIKIDHEIFHNKYL